jgi:hypothetical protein
MTRTGRLAAIGLVVAVALGAWWWSRPGREHVVLDFVELFPSAKENKPRAESHEVVEATIGGETSRAILAKEPGRMAFEFTVPDRAWLKLSVGMLEKAWTIPGDGVIVWIYITPLDQDGKKGYDAEGKLRTDELLSVTVNPYGTPADRNWHPFTFDLKSYAGKQVELVLVTRASPPSNPPKNDANGDFLVWGHPRLVID